MSGIKEKKEIKKESSVVVVFLGKKNGWVFFM